MNPPTATVLLVEDEPPLRAFVTELLTGHGYVVVHAGSVAEALREATTRAPDLVLLDLGLPDGDGREVLRRVRAWSDLPVLVLTARGLEREKVELLDAGADDYVTKPFAAGELLARVRVALRHRAGRAATEAGPSFRAEGLEIDLGARECRRAGTLQSLTPTEWRLLALFLRHPGRVLTHGYILREVWGPAWSQHTHYVRVHVHSLRRKIEAVPEEPRWVLTETGVGYRWAAPGS